MMKTHGLHITAALVLATTTLLAAIPANAHGCNATHIRNGLITGDCELSAEDLLRGYERYKARQNGLVEVVWAIPEPVLLPNLYVLDLDADTVGSAIQVTFNVGNNGATDAPSSEARTIIEFVRADNTLPNVPPQVDTVSVSPVTVGGTTLLLGSQFPIPDTRFSYDVVVTTTVDPDNRVDEVDNSAADNSEVYICRYHGTDPDQIFPSPGLPTCV